MKLASLQNAVCAVVKQIDSKHKASEYRILKLVLFKKKSLCLSAYSKL